MCAWNELPNKPRCSRGYVQQKVLSPNQYSFVLCLFASCLSVTKISNSNLEEMKDIKSRPWMFAFVQNFCKYFSFVIRTTASTLTILGTRFVPNKTSSWLWDVNSLKSVQFSLLNLYFCLSAFRSGNQTVGTKKNFAAHLRYCCTNLGGIIAVDNHTHAIKGRRGVLRWSQSNYQLKQLCNEAT